MCSSVTTPGDVVSFTALKNVFVSGVSFAAPQSDGAVRVGDVLGVSPHRVGVGLNADCHGHQCVHNVYYIGVGGGHDGLTVAA